MKTQKPSKQTLTRHGEGLNWWIEFKIYQNWIKFMYWKLWSILKKVKFWDLTRSYGVKIMRTTLSKLLCHMNWIEIWILIHKFEGNWIEIWIEFQNWWIINTIELNWNFHEERRIDFKKLSWFYPCLPMTESKPFKNLNGPLDPLPPP